MHANKSAGIHFWCERFKREGVARWEREALQHSAFNALVADATPNPRKQR